MLEERGDGVNFPDRFVILEMPAWRFWQSTVYNTQDKRTGNDMKIFLILFALALIFVIGSASMMRYLGDKSVTKKDKKDDKEE